MKIGIITIEQCNNYGAELQAYALQRKLHLMGYEAENINYYFYKHPKHRKTRGARPIFPLSFKNRVKEFFFPWMNRVKELRNCRAHQERKQRFESFVCEHVKHSRAYCTIEDLFDNPPRYDVYMTGSDQVWNPRAGASLSPYFLAFAPDGAKCVSYAASFGVSALTAHESEVMAKYLKRYQAIGVREAKGVELIAQMKEVVPATHVLDPTLLLDAEEWLKVARSMRTDDEPYLLVYDLIRSPELWTLAERIAKDKNLKIHRIGVEGPAEFIDRFAHAAAVVTNSFHGTAFSINFGKPFYVVKPRGMTNVGRIESLLNAVGMNDRLLACDQAATAIINLSMDHKLVQKKLNVLRKVSWNFLREAVS